MGDMAFSEAPAAISPKPPLDVRPGGRPSKATDAPASRAHKPASRKSADGLRPLDLATRKMLTKEIFFSPRSIWPM